MDLFKKHSELETIDQDTSSQRLTRSRVANVGSVAFRLANGFVVGTMIGQTIVHVVDNDTPMYVMAPPEGEPDYPELSREVEALAVSQNIITEDQHIWCDDMPIVDNIWTGGKVYSLKIDGQKITNGYAHINSDVCQYYIDSQASINGDGFLSKSEVKSFIVLEHETGHLNNIYDSEAEVHCYALQRAATRLLSLGLEPQEVMYYKGVAQSMYANMPEEYISQECRIGGVLDLTPGEYFNDAGDRWLPEQIPTRILPGIS